jgi:hypothetical protein
MQDRILTFFFLTACIVSGIATQDSCDSSIPHCQPSNPILRPNDYSIHFTARDGAGVCYDRRNKTKRITTVGTENTKIIYSPGFIRKRPYPNRIFVEYSIDCSGSDLAFIGFSYFHLPGKVCNRCVDYRTDFITVDRGDGGSGTHDMCDNSTNSTLVLDLQRQWSENLRVKFHTSRMKRYPGFEMYIICFNPPPRGKRSCHRHKPTPIQVPDYDRFLPTAAEQRELNKMNDVLFNAIPESDDISLEEIEDFGSGPDNDTVVVDNRVREACSEDITVVAERNLMASNPILRQQALSLQALLNQRRVAGNDTFNFTCSFMNNMLNCTVDDGFAPAVINGSYCTPNGGNRMMCDPFYGEFISTAGSVTIEAINCDGQSATLTARRGQSG